MMKISIAFLMLLQSFCSFADVSKLVKNTCQTNSLDTLLVVKIITHESKSYYKGKAQPWPWTLNIDGRGFYYRTFKEALFAAKKAYKNKVKKLGIGLGQIEWKYHKTRFNDLSEALNPKKNIKAVCDILDEGRSLGITNAYELAAYYHRPIRDSLAFKYADKVFK